MTDYFPLILIGSTGARLYPLASSDADDNAFGSIDSDSDSSSDGGCTSSSNSSSNIIESHPAAAKRRNPLLPSTSSSSHPPPPPVAGEAAAAAAAASPDDGSKIAQLPSNRCKSMLPIAGISLLERLLITLTASGFVKVCLAVAGGEIEKEIRAFVELYAEGNCIGSHSKVRGR
jgi:hypothetical protein